MSSAADLAARIESLQGDERAIIEQLLSRLEQGREAYGPWRVTDGRDYPNEALAEVIDALHYCAAALVRAGDDSRKQPGPTVDDLEKANRVAAILPAHPYPCRSALHPLDIGDHHRAPHAAAALVRLGHGPDPAQEVKRARCLAESERKGRKCIRELGELLRDRTPSGVGAAAQSNLTHALSRSWQYQRFVDAAHTAAYRLSTLRPPGDERVRHDDPIERLEGQCLQLLDKENDTETRLSQIFLSLRAAADQYERDYRRTEPFW